ncbi:Meiosis 1 arrest protein [Liparis tanakae]|uniref:Meiosis 1 arrest protein n=1 Tax=Liparis tanakae TaxID=230148 RepID=A0A4Z2J5W8_9TELE|nr:Meiosis 1 arrest protein [Liparis tanakae]
MRGMTRRLRRDDTGLSRMSMDNRKRPAGSSNSGNLVYWSSSFLRQPARVLIVEALPPWWSETCPVLCDALDNFLSLACSLDGPCRIPLLSLYAISRQQECLLPFVVRGNLARLRSCVEELRTLPGEGCVRGAARGGELLRQAVLDSLQQFKQSIRHTSAGSQANNNTSVEVSVVTVVTSQPGRGVVRHLEAGLKGADLVALKRLLVVQICSAADWGQDNHSPEAGHAETDGIESEREKTRREGGGRQMGASVRERSGEKNQIILEQGSSYRSVEAVSTTPHSGARSRVHPRKIHFESPE